jgi:sec-independent protein translocase protein TatC
MIALLVPMYLLYEIGIWCAQIFIKHTKAPDDVASDAASDSAKP